MDDRLGRAGGVRDHGGMASSTPTTIEPDLTTRPSDPELEDDDPNVAHIVRVRRGEDATAKVLEARVTGAPLEALCGKVWVPERDPRNLPLCSQCREIYDTYRSFNEKLPETPSD
jgi:hypothetical protein